MKVAGLDLGTVFARLCKRSAAPAAGPAPTCPAVRRPLPALAGRAAGGGGVGPAQPPGAGGGGGSPRPAREAGAWAAPGAKPLLLAALPDIGEEGAAESDPEAGACAPDPAQGLSRGCTDLCFPRKSGDLPSIFMRNVQDAIDNFTCETVSSLSSNSPITPTDLNNSWSGIQSYTTGLSTESSSIYSWRDDEFDKANTQRVHQSFWDVDEMLFEGKVNSQRKSLQTECEEWTKRSLHLRILGKQLLCPKGESFQQFQSKTTGSVLCISGSKLIPVASAVHKSLDCGSPRISVSDSSEYSFLEEEIFEVDGKIEEYLAFDNKELDDESLEQKKTHLVRKRNKCGIPPVSPNACIKDTVAAEIFDCVWSNFVEILEELIRKNWEAAITENDKQVDKLKAITSKLPHLLVSRTTGDTASVPPSRGSEARSTCFGSHFVPSQVHRFSSSFCSDLNGVMTIQAKPLQQRHANLADKIQNEQEEKQFSIGSSLLNSSRNRRGRITGNNSLSSSRVLLVSSRKMPTYRRLPSLTSDPLCSKTSNVYSNEVLRGNKLYTGLDRLSSPLVRTAQNKLPPINTETVEQNLSVPGSHQGFHRGRYPHSRVSSAVPESTERRPLRERTVVIDQFSRPNTTHTFRSDTPHKRSVTPMDFANQSWMGQGFLTGSQHYSKSFQRNPSTSRKRFQIAS
ncbi:protein FAM149A isoform X2 [Carettochelys insculpta]|uniref:protein FAM149A isoform X2 n=1 Tax=Carettochelys insculpta TaxID=44489 RepID=UPI003EBBD8CB